MCLRMKEKVRFKRNEESRKYNPGPAFSPKSLQLILQMLMPCGVSRNTLNSQNQEVLWSKGLVFRLNRINLQHFCFSGLYFCFLSITKCLPAGYFQKEAQREHPWVSDFWSQCLQRNETMELRTREGRVKEKEVYDCRRDDNVSLLRLLCGWKWALVGLVVAWSCRGTSGLGIEKTAEVKVTTGDVEKGAGRVAAYGPPG